MHWDQLGLRVDASIDSPEQAAALGLQVGDFVAFDANPDWLDNGYAVSHHLDNKADVAALLSALKAVVHSGVPVQMACHPVFALTEEVSSGASAGIEEDVSKIIGVDIGPVAEGQGARETGVTIPPMDSAGPHDDQLTRPGAHARTTTLKARHRSAVRSRPAARRRPRSTSCGRCRHAIPRPRRG